MVRPYSLTLVGIQFFCLGLLLFAGPLFPTFIPLRILALGMMAFGAWALLSMNQKTFQVFPEPRAEGQLVMHGPYRYIRHPMYTAVLGYSLAVTLDAFTLVKLLVWVILVIDLIAKLTYEERLLRQRFPNYQDYTASTARLIPFLF